MKNDFPLKNHINHRLPIYLISLVVVPIVISSLVILRTNPKKTERYSLFVGAYLDPNSSLKSKIQTYLASYNDKDISIFASDYSDQNFAIHYTSKGLTSDLLILSSKELNNLDKSIYSILDETNEFYSNTNYIDDEKHYGIAINDHLSNEIRYNEGEDYYFCIRNDSVHSLKFNENGKTDQTYTLIKSILNEE